jgi:predicted sulfurtransferase
MMKKSILKLGLCALLSVNLISGYEAATGLNSFSFTAEVAAAEATQVKGKISNISQKAKTIAIAGKDDSLFFLKFNDATELKGVESSKDFKVGEAIVASYKVEGGENIATTLEKALVKLPKGVKEIKTDELAKMMAEGKGVVVVDARPPIKYDEFHIPGSVSVPYSKLVKMGDDGKKLLEKYMDKQLVFYCGGNT